MVDAAAGAVVFGAVVGELVAWAVVASMVAGFVVDRRSVGVAGVAIGIHSLVVDMQAAVAALGSLSEGIRPLERTFLS